MQIYFLLNIICIACHIVKNNAHIVPSFLKGEGNCSLITGIGKGHFLTIVINRTMAFIYQFADT